MKTILVDAVDTFVVEADGAFKIFKEMQDLLDTFPNRKILVTGATDEQSRVWFAEKMPYEIFTLKHDPEKTDPEYFRKLLEHFNLTKDDAVYFEHNPEAARSAESVGIKTYHYDNDVRDLKALKEFLVKNL